ncbi:MAG: hypothetical protein M1813_007243 [Trichoglossum hirsutum]|nr:MAG: hypothetical protein M1813_007243 [Trichoglossum hirsutum]
MQSDRIRLLVGPNEKPFQIPRDLLTLHSPVFDKMCTLPFKESIDQLIKLPEDEPSAFEDFFIWLHSYEPRVPAKADSLIDLAVLADKYHICLLKNQTSNEIRTALSEKRWKLTPDMVRTVYTSTPAGSILRRLCSLGFVARNSVPVDILENKDYDTWKSVFSDFSDLGWDYFRRVQMGQARVTITAGSACRFHDHSDISDLEKEDTGTCPYPNGAPVTMPEEKISSPPTPKAVQAEP